MQDISLSSTNLSAQQRDYRVALYLALFTVLYNFVEGIISTLLGYADETLALFGFGLDSFIEVISGLGILHLITRIQKNPDTTSDTFEIQALRITGMAFYLLSASLTLGALLNFIQDKKPQTTFGGAMVALASIVTMYFLTRSKVKIGKRLGSSPIIADGHCTKVCLYMSVILLIASLLYEFTSFAYADSIGTIGIVYYALNEGKEAFAKAKGKLTCACGTAQETCTP